MEPGSLDALRGELVNLRKVLLGLEVGMLYQKQDYDQKMLIDVVSLEKIPVDQMAAKVIGQIQRK
jgi:hypothetical protein